MNIIKIKKTLIYYYNNEKYTFPISVRYIIPIYKKTYENIMIGLFFISL